MTTLYALSAEGISRYIGKTVKPLDRRLQEHLCDARRGMQNHRCNWLRSLTKPPRIEQILVTEDRYAAAAERFAIALFGRENLVNGTDGGEGTVGRETTSKTREKIRAAKKGKSNGNEGKKHTTERRAKNRTAHLGQTPTASARANQSAAQRGKKRAPFTPEHRANISASHKGKGHRHTPETRAKISAAKKGKPFTSEHRASIGAAQRGKKRGPLTSEHRAKIGAGLRKKS